jgi:hypothetical protein
MAYHGMSCCEVIFFRLVQDLSLPAFLQQHFLLRLFEFRDSWNLRARSAQVGLDITGIFLWFVWCKIAILRWPGSVGSSGKPCSGTKFQHFSLGHYWFLVDFGWFSPLPCDLAVLSCA